MFKNASKMKWKHKEGGSISKKKIKELEENQRKKIIALCAPKPGAKVIKRKPSLEEVKATIHQWLDGLVTVNPNDLNNKINAVVEEQRVKRFNDIRDNFTKDMNEVLVRMNKQKIIKEYVNKF